MSLIPSTIAINLSVAFNTETLAAVNGLAAAISASGNAGAAPAAAAANVKAADKGQAKDTNTGGDASSDSPAVTIYWFSSANDTVGTVDSEEAFKALKKKDAKVVKITEAKYQAKLAELEKAKAAAEADDDDDEVPTEQDLIDAFGAYLDPNLDEDVKTERRAFVGPIVKRFGAKKASAIPEEHRKLALNLLARKVAGEDVDPENDEFQEVDEDASLV